MKTNDFIRRKAFVGLLVCMSVVTLSAANTTETVEQVKGTVTLSADVDYVITSSTPFADGAVLNIANTDNAVVILSQVKPSAVSSLYKYIQVNGVKASAANCQVKIYGDGCIILPTTPPSVRSRSTPRTVVKARQRSLPLDSASLWTAKPSTTRFAASP